MLEIGNKLRENGYLSNLYINFAVMSAINGVPLLVEGDPGVGKTSLAYATAKMLDLELLRVQFYDGLSYDKILYDYDYQKQLLTIQAIQGTIKESLAGKDLQESLDAAGKINFYGRDFLIERPILKAISGKKRYVLLLDEAEKASEEIEYTLLEVLENFSILIPQYGTVTCPEEMRPIVDDDLEKVLHTLDEKEFASVFRDKFVNAFVELKQKLDTSHEIAAVKNIRLESDTLKLRCMY